MANVVQCDVCKKVAPSMPWHIRWLLGGSPFLSDICSVACLLTKAEDWLKTEDTIRRGYEAEAAKWGQQRQVVEQRIEPAPNGDGIVEQAVT